MSRRSDQQYLLHKQYRDASNLKARINLHNRFKTNPYDWFHFVFDQFNLPQNAAIIELGCGSGNLWVRNLERVPADWDITLSDFSPGMLDEARQNLSSANHQFHFKIIDAQQLPIQDEQLDAVVANHMLYHIPDRPKALAEIHRVLKPGGSFIAATNGEKHLAELDALYEQLRPELRHTIDRNFSAGAFTLENGAEQLDPWFQTEIRYYEDSLVVTEAEPLLAYLQSMIPFEDFQVSPKQLADLSQMLAARIQAEGHILITKSTGIFVSKKKPR
jgi:ubiquinone/menaquinone biosynthesis C-methylase UbiE